MVVYNFDFFAFEPQTHLGGWSISETLHQFITDNLEAGSTILELGSGYGTEVLSTRYRMISIEHDIRFIGKYQSKYIYAPIVNQWYSVEHVEHGLKNISYDAILIDGPPAEQSKRMGFSLNLDMFNTDVLMIFDDTNRKDEQELFFNVVSKIPNRRVSHLLNNEFSVIYPKD